VVVVGTVLVGVVCRVVVVAVVADVVGV
jgi:hypothetical protein